MEPLQRILFPLSKTRGVESSTSNNDTDDAIPIAIRMSNSNTITPIKDYDRQQPFPGKEYLPWQWPRQLPRWSSNVFQILAVVHIRSLIKSFLASKTPEIPAHVPPELPTLPTEVNRRGDNVQRETIDYHMSSLTSLPLSTVSFDHDEQQQLSSTSIVSTRERERRPSIDYDGYSEEPPIPNDTFHCNDNDNSEDRMPEDPWDLSYLFTNEPDPHIAIEAVEEILNLARRLESMPGMYRSLPSYRRLRWDVSLQSKSIFGDDWYNEGGVTMTSRRSDLDQLYRSTREKMNAYCHDGEDEQRGSTVPFSSMPHKTNSRAGYNQKYRRWPPPSPIHSRPPQQ